MTDSERWAAVAASVPTEARAQRERPFWRELVRSFGWRRIADAGCGSGFHVSLLRGLGVEVVGFDVAIAVVRGGAASLVGDIQCPPLRAAAFDAVLCLGNTLSLLPSRSVQRSAVAALALPLRGGGTLVVQGEDVGRLVAGGPVVRTRTLAGSEVHLRVFERAGRRVTMLAGVVTPGRESGLEGTLLLPTSSRTVVKMGRLAGLVPVPLPVAPPGGGESWWTALSAPSP